MLVDAELISQLTRGDGRCEFPRNVQLGKIIKHMRELVASIPRSEYGESFTEEFHRSWNNSCRVTRFVTLWTEGFIPKGSSRVVRNIVPNFDVVQTTYSNFLEAIIVTLMEVIRRQAVNERSNTALALQDLFTCWIPVLRSNGDQEMYDFELLNNLCNYLAFMLRDCVATKSFSPSDFGWLQPTLNLHNLALHYFETLMDEKYLVSTVSRSIQMCTYHPDLPLSCDVILASVHLFSELISKFPGVLEKARSRKLSVFATLTQFAMGGTGLKPICKLLSNIILLPSTRPMDPDVFDRFKPCLFSGLYMLEDGPAGIRGRIIEALKFGLQNFPELFTDDESVSVVQYVVEEDPWQGDTGAVDEDFPQNQDQAQDAQNYANDGTNEDDFRTLSEPSDREELDDEDFNDSYYVDDDEEHRVETEDVTTAKVDGPTAVEIVAIAATPRGHHSGEAVATAAYRGHHDGETVAMAASSSGHHGSALAGGHQESVPAMVHHSAQQATVRESSNEPESTSRVPLEGLKRAALKLEALMKNRQNVEQELILSILRDSLEEPDVGV